jgi:hypothetical protein
MANQQEEKSQESQKPTQSFWKSTRKTLHAASFGAQKYKRMVQKKMDLATTNRKFPALYSELGKLIDDLYAAGEKDFITRQEVNDLLVKLQHLKETAATQERDLEVIKNENPEAVERETAPVEKVASVEESAPVEEEQKKQD